MSSLESSVLLITLEVSKYDKGNIYFEYIQYLSKYDNVSIVYLDEMKNNLGDKKTKDEILLLVQEKAIDSSILMYEEADLTFLSKLRELSYLVYFSTDDVTLFDKTTRYIGQVVDLVLSFDLIDPSIYSYYGINSKFFPACYNENLYKPLDLEKDIDISFIGIRYKSWRDEYITYIENSGFKIETYGLGTKNYISYEELPNIFNRSKINLCFNGSNQLNEITDRMFQFKGRNPEISLCGSFLLTEYFVGLEKIYVIGEEIDVFYDKETLVEKIKFYLDNEEERNRIAQNGYRKALKMFTLEQFEKRLLENIRYGIKGKNINSLTHQVYSKIYIDHEFLKKYTHKRLMYMFKFIKSSQYGYAIEEFNFIRLKGKIGFTLILHEVYNLIEKIMKRNFPSFLSRLKKIKNLLLNKRNIR